MLTQGRSFLGNDTCAEAVEISTKRLSAVGRQCVRLADLWSNDTPGSPANDKTGDTPGSPANDKTGDMADSHADDKTGSPNAVTNQPPLFL